MQRRLELDGMVNLRDLGGYPTRGGTQTRWRAFLRSEHVRTWSPAAQQGLLEYGVSLVIDLRTPQEATALPNGFADSTRAQYRNIPIVTLEQVQSERYQTIDRERTDNVELYLFMLEECRPQIREVLTAMAGNDKGATVFHCYGGKDRTGVIAALLLSLAEAHEDAIVEDYALTGEYMREVFAAFHADAVAAGADGGRMTMAYAALPQTMRRMLQHLNDCHGGGPAYVSACGMPERDIARLRDRLLCVGSEG